MTAGTWNSGARRFYARRVDQRLIANQETAMWKQYRKTFVVTQLFIVVLCIGAYLFAKVPMIAVLFTFVVMQVFGFLGAAWAASLRRRMDRQANTLPLTRRRA
jgi:hypothetical protein